MVSPTPSEAADDGSAAFQIVRDDRGFLALREVWSALSVPSVFLTWEWASCWWKAYGEGRRPWVVVVRDGGGAVTALAPLCLEETRIGRLPAGRVLTWIGGGEACADHLDVVAVNDDARRAVLDVLWRHRHEWDGIAISDLPQASPTCRLLARWAAAHGLRFRETVQDECSVLALPSDWASLEACLSSHFRQHLRRDGRRLSTNHGARTVFCQEEAEVQPFMDTLEHLHAERWGTVDGGAGVFRRPRFRAFHRELAPALFRRGALRLAVLRGHEGALAAFYGFAHGGVISFYQAGLSGRVPTLSCGQVLFADVIRHAVEEGMVEFDFLRGRDPYKERWTSGVRTTMSAFVVAPSVGGHWAWWLRTGRRWLKRLRESRS